MKTFRQIAKSILSMAIGIAVGTMVSWLLLAIGYHLGAMSAKDKIGIERGPTEVLMEGGIKEFFILK